MRVHAAAHASAPTSAAPARRSGCRAGRRKQRARVDNADTRERPATPRASALHVDVEMRHSPPQPPPPPPTTPSAPPPLPSSLSASAPTFVPVRQGGSVLSVGLIRPLRSIAVGSACDVSVSNMNASCAMSRSAIVVLVHGRVSGPPGPKGGRARLSAHRSMSHWGCALVPSVAWTATKSDAPNTTAVRRERRGLWLARARRAAMGRTRISVGGWAAWGSCVVAPAPACGRSLRNC